MNVIIEIPKERTYKLPYGRFKAGIAKVDSKPAKSGSDQLNCIIHFSNIQIAGMELWDCCARAIFPFDLHSNSQLRNFLEGLLGEEFFVERSGQGIDLNAVLKGMDCEIDIAHGPHDEDKFDWPMVLVPNVYPVSKEVS